jgi:dimethylamine monooxygenase subunit C
MSEAVMNVYLSQHVKDATADTACGENSDLPVFTSLDWRPARTHLIVSDEAGLAAVKRLLAKLVQVAGDRFKLHLLGRESKVNVLPLPDRMEVYVNPDDCSFREILRASICASSSPVQLYAAGSQSFLLSVSGLARSGERGSLAVQAELAGSGARDVQCVCCQNIYRDIDYRAFECPRCAVTLIVRDHYSASVGAFETVALHPADANLKTLQRQRLW